MSVASVREYLKQFGLDSKVEEFEESSATVELAAEALNCEGQRIAKSLSFKVDDTPILVISAGDAKIDNAKYKSYFKSKAKMLSPDEVKDFIGHEIGGVCPFAINKGVKVYLDESLPTNSYNPKNIKGIRKDII